MTPAPASPVPNDRAAWSWLGAILAAALAVRLIDIGHSLWTDEIASVMFAGRPVPLLWSDWIVRETNPPLFYTLLAGWRALFGHGDVAARLLPVLIGLAGIPFAFLMTRAAAGTRAGLICAGLIALQQQHVLYSQQVRGYIIVHTAALAALYAALLFMDPVRAGRRTRAALLYVAASILAVYGHTTGVLVPFVVSLFVIVHLALRRDWRGAALWAGANLLVLIAWAWWGRITWLQQQAPASISWIEPTTLRSAAIATVQGWLPWQLGLGRILSFPLAAIAFVAGAWTLRRSRGLLLPFVTIATPLLLFALSQVTPAYLSRTIFWVSGPFLAVVAAAIARIADRRLFVAALAAALMLSAWGLANWLARPDIGWPTVIERIQARDPRATVLTRGRGMLSMLRHACRPPACLLELRSVPGVESWPRDFAVDGMIDGPAAQALLARRPALFVVSRGEADPAPVLRGLGHAVSSETIQPENDAAVTVSRWAAD